MGFNIFETILTGKGLTVAHCLKQGFGQFCTTKYNTRNLVEKHFNNT